MQQETNMSWSEIAALTHKTQVENFGFCTCEEQENYPFEDCPRANDDETAQEYAYRRAFTRGYAHGIQDKKEGYYNEAPLSGEWAGMSITEIIGDLIDEAGDEYSQDICDEYERGYFSANEYNEAAQ